MESRKLFAWCAMAAMTTFAACTGGGGKAEQQNYDDEDATPGIDVQDKTVYGICGSGTSMNTLMLITDNNDTLELSTAECKEQGRLFGGLSLGDKLAVMTEKRDGEDVATLVINMSTMLGKWVEPSPLDGNTMTGIELREGGIAVSINQDLRVYKSWRIFNGRLVLLSYGDDTIDGGLEEVDTFDIQNLGSDSLVVFNGEDGFIFSRQQ